MDSNRLIPAKTSEVGSSSAIIPDDKGVYQD